jgi:hypothetical protein
VGVFRLSSAEPGRLRRVLRGDLPDDEGERSHAKPDLEALTVLPPFEDHPYGALLGLGSGSGAARDRGFVCALAADGSIAGEPDELTLAPLYGLLSEHVGDLNIEGAATMGDRLWLLHRGNADGGANLVAELSLEELMRSLQDDLCLEAEELEQVRASRLLSCPHRCRSTASSSTRGAEPSLVLRAKPRERGVQRLVERQRLVRAA